MDDKANAGDKDRKKKQSTGKSNRSATTSREQPSLNFETKDPLPCSAPKGMDCKPVLVPLEHSGEPIEYLIPRKTLSSYKFCPCQWEQHLGVPVTEGEVITFIYTEGTQPCSHGSRAVQSCPEKNAAEKRKINISFSVLECDCLHSWSIFGCIYKSQFRRSSSSALKIRELAFISCLTLYFQGGFY